MRHRYATSKHRIGALYGPPDEDDSWVWVRAEIVVTPSESGPPTVFVVAHWRCPDLGASTPLGTLSDPPSTTKASE
jgi:hypothetical protein